MSSNTTTIKNEPIVIKGENLTADEMLKQVLTHVSANDKRHSLLVEALERKLEDLVEDRAKAKADKAIAAYKDSATDRMIVSQVEHAEEVRRLNDHIAKQKQELKAKDLALEEEISSMQRRFKTEKQKLAADLLNLEGSLTRLGVIVETVSKWKLDKDAVAKAIFDSRSSIRIKRKDLVR